MNNSRRIATALGCCCGLLLGSEPPLVAQPTQRQVAITIDDGPASGTGRDLEMFQDISQGIREAFVAEDVPAIMFVNESQLHVPDQRDARIRILDEWLQAGLELGNHTYSHQRLGGSELRDFFDDIIKGEVVSRPLLRRHERPLTWFRYPYLSTEQGQRAADVERFLAERNYQIAPVTVDYKDYSYASNYSRYLRAGEDERAAELFASVMRALDQAFDESEQSSRELLGYELPQVLLIHCNEMNAKNLRETIGRIRGRGYSFVSLEQALQDPAYHTSGLPPGSLGGSFLGALSRRNEDEFFPFASSKDDRGWSKEVAVTQGRATLVRFQARIEGEYLIVKATHADGWHTYAMDNALRAAEALQGKQSLGIEQGLEIKVESGLELQGRWLQTQPKDLSQPEIRWYTYGFDQTALFAGRLKRITKDDVRLRIRGQACNGETCRQVDVKLEFEIAKSADDGPSATERIKAILTGMVPVKSPSEPGNP